MRLESPLKSIRLKCLDCTCNQPLEVKLCPSSDCPLWAYRFGKRPTAEILSTFEATKPLPWLQKLYDDRQKRAEKAKARFETGNLSADCLEDE